ncbi:MAG: MalY/PatB family protein [Anaeroplasmataceae bacterium]
MFNFDNIANRKNTNSLKWDAVSTELPMWLGDMDFESPQEVVKALEKRVAVKAYGYSITSDEYFKAYQAFWQRRHNVWIDTDSMIFATGIVPAISSIVRKITTPAENVLIMAPVYNIFYNCIHNNGRYILSSDLVYDNYKYSVDYKDLEEKLALGQTSMMILCNPHNPIGKVWTKEELTKIGNLCLKYNVTLVSDEIHCDIVTPGMEYTSILALSEDIRNNSIVLISASKSFNLAGLQSATVVVPNPSLRHKVWRGLNTDDVAEPNFFCLDAVTAALTKCDAWLDELKEYIYTNKKLYSDYIFNNIPDLHVVQSDATYFMWIDTSKLTKDASDFVEFLNKKTGLLVASGEEYGKCGKHFIRVTIATSRAIVLDSLERLKRAAELYKNNK